jgi:hypothetical protein
MCSRQQPGVAAESAENFAAALAGDMSDVTQRQENEGALRGAVVRAASRPLSASENK